MSRIPTPATIADAPEAAQPLLQAVEKQVGTVPNLFRIAANSPAALQAYLGAEAAIAKGGIRPQTRERIALAVAEVNGCDYCLSAHTYFGKTLAKLDDAEITANRNGASNDPKADAAVRLAAQIARARGHVDAADVEAFKAAGYTDANVVEVVLLVALNSFTNFLNETVKTEIDFPVVTVRKAAA